MRLGIFGASGRVGTRMVELALSSPGIELAAVFVRPGSRLSGMPVAGRGMITLTAVAAVPGGQMMQVSGPDGSPMHVQVPQGVQPGQQFSFQIIAPDGGAAPVAMGTPMC